MNATHTPKPWRIDPAGQETLQNVIMSEATGGTIAVVYGSDADAALLVTAPDLLEALEGLFEHCSMVHRHWGDGCNQREADAAVSLARQAINAARGTPSK